LNFYQS
jgi:hypothetical protein